MSNERLPPPFELQAVANPTLEIRSGVIIAALFFLGFGGWAALWRLDAAVAATGVLQVSGQRQTVQHREGGVVGEILVHEGQRVTRGQVLLRLAAAEVVAQERALAAEAIRLLAQRARLEAEEVGSTTLSTPPEFAALPKENRFEAEAALHLQAAELAARQGTLSGATRRARAAGAAVDSAGRGLWNAGSLIGRAASTDQ